MINLSVLFCRNPNIDEKIQVHKSVLIRKQKKKEKRKKEKEKRKQRKKRRRTQEERNEKI